MANIYIDELGNIFAALTNLDMKPMKNHLRVNIKCILFFLSIIVVRFKVLEILMFNQIKRFSILSILVFSCASFGYNGAGGMDGAGYVHGYPDYYQGRVYYGGGRHYWRGNGMNDAGYIHGHPDNYQGNAYYGGGRHYWRGNGMRCQYVKQCHRHYHRIHCQPVRYCQ